MINNLGIQKSGTRYTNTHTFDKKIKSVTTHCGCTDSIVDEYNVTYSINVPIVTAKISKQVNLTVRFEDNSTEVITNNFIINP